MLVLKQSTQMWPFSSGGSSDRSEPPWLWVWTADAKLLSLSLLWTALLHYN